MESFVSSYGITEYALFREKMRNGNALVAGSAALALYLKQEGVDPGFEPNDMDIFLEAPMGIGERFSFMSFLNHHLVGQLALLLIRSGYNLNQSCSGNLSYNKLNPSEIHSVLFFEHPHLLKKIQLICIRTRDMVSYIQRAFDLSVCMSWWNPAEDHFHTYLPEYTLEKKMFLNTLLSETKKSSERLLKYQLRGFECMKSPPPRFKEADTLEGASLPDFELRGVMAFDCIQHEEREISTFLCESPWNIVIRTGETYHAFDRTTWRDYLISKKKVNEWGNTVYHTPFLQTLTENQIDLFQYADWSLFELIPLPSLDGTSHIYHRLIGYRVMESAHLQRDQVIEPTSTAELAV